MTLLAQLTVLAAIISAGVTYGTDAFLRPCPTTRPGRVGDATLTAIMGDVHRYGDRRLPAPDPRHRHRRHRVQLRRRPAILPSP